MNKNYCCLNFFNLESNLNEMGNAISFTSRHSQLFTSLLWRALRSRRYGYYVTTWRNSQRHLFILTFVIKFEGIFHLLPITPFIVIDSDNNTQRFSNYVLESNITTVPSNSVKSLRNCIKIFQNFWTKWHKECKLSSNEIWHVKFKRRNYGIFEGSFVFKYPLRRIQIR